ncbi:hypothetical protein BV497_14955 [Fulvimonas soli]|nr:hypothetical protein BV497_14955 [Fulvimonas soli]
MALDLQLSDREMFLIGMIVAHWGSLEHEVFTQTLLSFDSREEPAEALPKAMNNIQFAQVLSLWKERVVDTSTGERLSSFRVVYDTLVNLKEPRDALIHGMWLWSPESGGRISTVRVKKREVITTHFNADYLEDFAFRLAKLNFMIRYPRGTIDLAAERQSDGFYISRKFLEMMTKPAEASTNSESSSDA